jgi:hypothetical protein
LAEPPQPPAIPPKIRVHRREAIAMGLMALVPALALLGTFGPSNQHVERGDEALRLETLYPSLLRLQMRDKLKIRVTNRSEKPLSRVALRIEQSYLSGFAEVSFSPDVSDAYLVELKDLQPGEVRLVAVELDAERYGRHRGQVTASYDGKAVTLELSTFVYP